MQGQSGNPKGKPRGTKHWITTERENLELVLRQYLGDKKQMNKAMQAVDRLFQLAIEAEDKVAVQAMKVLLDKVLPSPKSAEEVTEDKAPSVHIVIENTTDKVTIDGKTINHEDA